MTDGEDKKQQRARKFHEAQGSFKEVFIALIILVAIILILINVL